MKFRFINTILNLIGFTVIIGSATLVVNLDHRMPDPASPLKAISMCVDCPTPEKEGSVLFGLMAKFGVREYFVTAEAVYCIPNHAEKDKLVNRHLIADRIAFVDRGKVSLLDKIVRLQHAGAAAVIIADDGQCDEKFQGCGPRVGSLIEGGFSAHDQIENWKDISIPVLLVTKRTADRMRLLMDVQQMKVPRLGLQFVTPLKSVVGGSEEL